MKTETYANSPIRCCETCAHYREDSVLKGPRFAMCSRFMKYAEFSIRESFAGEAGCGADLREWRAMPPRQPKRSIRQRLFDYWLA